MSGLSIGAGIVAFMVSFWFSFWAAFNQLVVPLAEHVKGIGDVLELQYLGGEITMSLIVGFGVAILAALLVSDGIEAFRDEIAEAVANRVKEAPQ